MKQSYKKVNSWLSALPVILICAFILRLFQLSNQSLWLDEILNLTWSRLATAGDIIKLLSEKDNSPPLYYLFQHFWLYLGQSEAIVRLPSVIAGVITVFLGYKTARLFFDKSISGLCALLLSISPFFIWISQEARMYAFLGMFGLASFYWFIRAVREDSLKTWSFYTLFSLFTIYTHYYGFFTILAEFAFLLSTIRSKSTIKHYAYSLIIVLFLFTPGLILFMKQFLNSTRRQEGLFPSTIWAVPHAFFDFSVGYSLIPVGFKFYFRNPLYFIVVSALAGLAFIVPFINGVYLLIKRNIYLPLFYFFIPLLASFAVSLKVHIFGSKYLVCSAVAYFIILAYGLFNLKGKFLRLVFITLILVIMALSTLRYYSSCYFSKGGLREVAQFILKNERKGDYIIFPQPIASVAFAYYYSGKNAALGLLTDKKEVDTGRLSFKPGERIWYIDDLEFIYDPSGSVKKYLSKYAQEEESCIVRNVKIIRYSVKE